LSKGHVYAIIMKLTNGTILNLISFGYFLVA
jgi:hypothetical protein